MPITVKKKKITTQWNILYEYTSNTILHHGGKGSVLVFYIVEQGNFYGLFEGFFFVLEKQKYSILDKLLLHPILQFCLVSPHTSFN